MVSVEAIGLGAKLAQIAIDTPDVVALVHWCWLRCGGVHYELASFSSTSRDLEEASEHSWMTAPHDRSHAEAAALAAEIFIPHNSTAGRLLERKAEIKAV